MEALLLSIRLAVCVSAILFVIGMPLAYWLAYSRWRGKFLVEVGCRAAAGAAADGAGILRAGGDGAARAAG